MPLFVIKGVAEFGEVDAQRKRQRNTDFLSGEIIGSSDIDDAPWLALRISPLQTDSLPFVSKIYWPENADDAIMDAP